MSVQVGAGNHYSLFFKDGVVYSVGENNESQLGRGEVTAVGVAWADIGTVNLPDGFEGEIAAISAGMLHGAFLTAAGAVYAWGDNNTGKLGQGTTTNYETLIPTKIEALDGVVIKNIYMTNGASYAISEDGILYSWGQNTNGQLGIGNLVNQGAPIAVDASAFSGDKVASLAWGTSFALVLTEGGDVYAMGGNVQGQLGQGTSGSATRSNVPVLVDIPGTVVKVAAGTNTAFAITDDGKVWGWGQNDYGQLIRGEIADGIMTDPDRANATLPIEIQGLPEGVTDIHVGSRWAIALTQDGEVWAWGRNDEGWLGIENSTGAVETLVAPTRIEAFDGINILSITGGPNHSLAVDDQGNIYGWGNTAHGRLGTEQPANTWAAGPILIPLESDGREVVLGSTSADADLSGGDLPEGKTGFSIYGFGGNDTITGSDGRDYLNGGVGDDILFGGAGDDVLIGASGNDTLDGGSGADSMSGGKGDDVYVVDNLGDEVIEKADEGTDLVKASISYTLSAHVENLTLTGSADLNGTGNGLANTIIGNSGNNILNGGAGNDVLHGGSGNDRLYGGSGNDRLYGGNGHDLLDGGTGADRLEGGKGNDTYVVDNRNDTVVERAGEGRDLVKASVSYTLSSHVEDLTLTGKANLHGTGNGLANVITGNSGNNVLNGGAGNDVLHGGSGNDRLYGGAGNDRLNGGNGNDLLDGGAGADRLEGGRGHDIYVVDNRNDRVIEKAGEGIDLVRASVSHTLSNHVENLTLTGTANLSGTGNTLANVITGNSGRNTLDGGRGNDTLNGGAGNDKLIGGLGADKLTGGAGADTFVFRSIHESTVAASGRDMILDFLQRQGDRIDVREIDANTRLAGDQAFTFIGDEAFGRTAGELRYEKKGGDTFVYGDVNGDGRADFSIRVDGSIDFVKADFLL